MMFDFALKRQGCLHAPNVNGNEAAVQGQQVTSKPRMLSQAPRPGANSPASIVVIVQPGRETPRE